MCQSLLLLLSLFYYVLSLLISFLSLLLHEILCLVSLTYTYNFHFHLCHARSCFAHINFHGGLIFMKTLGCEEREREEGGAEKRKEEEEVYKLCVIFHSKFVICENSQNVAWIFSLSSQFSLPFHGMEMTFILLFPFPGEDPNDLRFLSPLKILLNFKFLLENNAGCLSHKSLHIPTTNRESKSFKYLQWNFRGISTLSVHFPGWKKGSEVGQILMIHAALIFPSRHPQ